MARPPKIEVTLHGGPSDGKKVFVSPDADEYRDPGGGRNQAGSLAYVDDPPATGGVYVRDPKGVFRWETE